MNIVYETGFFIDVKNFFSAPLNKLNFDCKSVTCKINLLISSFIDFISFSKCEESAAWFFVCGWGGLDLSLYWKAEFKNSFNLDSFFKRFDRGVLKMLSNFFQQLGWYFFFIGKSC